MAWISVPTPCTLHMQSFRNPELEIYTINEICPHDRWLQKLISGFRSCEREGNTFDMIVYTPISAVARSENLFILHLLQVRRQLLESLAVAEANALRQYPADLAAVLDGKALQILLRPGLKEDLLRLGLQCKVCYRLTAHLHMRTVSCQSTCFNVSPSDVAIRMQHIHQSSNSVRE